MALIPHQRRHTRQLNVRISPDLTHTLADYCRFLASSRNHVVEQSLRYAFGCHRDFIAWQREQETTGEDKERPREDA